MRQTVIKRYSEAFKLQVVREYEGGTSMHELREKYGIGGGNTVRGWVEKYGRVGVRHKLLVIQSPEEQEQVKQLKVRTSQLEKLVAQLMLDKVMLETTLQVAEERLGLDLKKSTVWAS
jgi:transposase-like protein